jgi:hypothetical protein
VGIAVLTGAFILGSSLVAAATGTPFGTLVMFLGGASVVAVSEAFGESGVAVAVEEETAGLTGTLLFSVFELSLAGGAMLFDCARALIDGAQQASAMIRPGKTFFMMHSNS